MPHPNKAITYWLVVMCATIFTMIVVGGITRLTESGLSMVEWRPLFGTLPPLSDGEWQRVFMEYKNYPQYQLVNAGMSLDAFKTIFYWEYGHRLLGRLIGVMFALPFFFFLLTGQIEASLKPKLWLALGLGGMQGLMGWYMVKSGLVDEPLVSHYRLAAHLCLALLIFAYLSWLVLGQLQVSRVSVSRLFNRTALLFVGLLIIQIVWGAFVAGNRAGYGFNTYPLMNGQWLPDVALNLLPIWHNFLDNNAMLQFIHRWVGAAVLLTATALMLIAFLREQTTVKVMVLALLAAVLLQFWLGVMTLLYVVPIGLGSLHQAGACVVVLAVVILLYRTRTEAS
ncbi:MAG: cytochrome c oxidase assembly protein subunit 15 [Candidatus Azotimanducaceae bacterium]|jgi:cytochrome c oxidase assembly protein subunit 15